MSGRVHTEAEGFVERRLPVVTAHSGLLLDNSLLGGDVHHVKLHVKICGHTHTINIIFGSRISYLALHEEKIDALRQQ